MFKDIAVHLTGSSEDEVRLAQAVPIAKAFDAHITGLHLHLLPEVVARGEFGYTQILPEMINRSREEAEENHARLDARLAGLGVSYAMERLEVFPSVAGRALAGAARLSDLFIGTRPYGDPGAGEDIEEAVLFESGHGCLFLPPKDETPRSFSRILVAWKNTRESVRAVSEALPFLKRADAVILAIAGDGEEIDRADDQIRHLGRHGVTAELRRVHGGGNAGSALLEEAERSGADMIVMGGYGHSRMRQWLLGGVTRHVLSEAGLPVFMAH